MSCDEIAAGTAWLADLNGVDGADETYGPAKWLTIYDGSGAADPAFAGPDYSQSPQLEGAENREFAGHLPQRSPSSDPAIVKAYRTFVETAEPGGRSTAAARAAAPAALRSRPPPSSPRARRRVQQRGWVRGADRGGRAGRRPSGAAPQRGRGPTTLTRSATISVSTHRSPLVRRRQRGDGPASWPAASRSGRRTVDAGGRHDMSPVAPEIFDGAGRGRRAWRSAAGPGPPDRPTVVAAHGITANHTSFDLVARELGIGDDGGGARPARARAQQWDHRSLRHHRPRR